MVSACVRLLVDAICMLVVALEVFQHAIHNKSSSIHALAVAHHPMRTHAFPPLHLSIARLWPRLPQPTHALLLLVRGLTAGRPTRIARRSPTWTRTAARCWRTCVNRALIVSAEALCAKAGQSHCTGIAMWRMQCRGPCTQHSLSLGNCYLLDSHVPSCALGSWRPDGKESMMQ